MKLLAIELGGIALETALGDESLENLRRLMELGAFGGRTGDRSQLGALLVSAGERRSLSADGGAEALDAEIGALLENIDRDTVVLALASQGDDAADGWYVLAAPGTVPAGETGAVEPAYLAGLVTDLLAREAAPVEEDDDEALIRERFSGLGYIS